MEFVLTNAPEAYDYGYARDLDNVVVTDRFPLRTLVVPTSHIEYQIGRYQSGLYVTFRSATYEGAVAAAMAF